jgi:hypothetical protein
MTRKERAEFVKLRIKRLEDLLSTLQDELDYLEEDDEYELDYSEDEGEDEDEGDEEEE